MASIKCKTSNFKNMSTLLAWVNDEVETLKVEDFLKVELPNKDFCTVCGNNTNGLPCQNDNCPN